MPFTEFEKEFGSLLSGYELAIFNNIFNSLHSVKFVHLIYQLFYLGPIEQNVQQSSGTRGTYEL